MFGSLLVAALVAGSPTVEDTSHHQTAKIEVVGDDGGAVALHAYCLGPAGEVLAGVGGKSVLRVAGARGFTAQEVDTPTEIRVYDPDSSELLEVWPVPVKPEAMCTAPDGRVYVAGEGKLLVLDELGSVETSVTAPHARLLLENDAELRAAAQAELEQNRGMFDEQIAEFQKQLEKFEGRDDLDANEQAMKQQAEANIQAFEQFADQWNVPIEEHMASMRATKMKFSSISVGEDNVYVTVPGLKGYGFEVWRIDPDLGDGEKIVSDLSGCCGQMEARAHGDELFVAENGRHRVVRFDPEGVLQGMWGERAARDAGGAGFGSCCNPMNLAFEPGGVVYAAEAEGAIKRYSPDGQFLGMVAHCELPPGCKNVAVRVDPERERVYMIDIVRGGIVVFSPREALKPKARRITEL